jgi:protein-disulfide isomerase
LGWTFVRAGHFIILVVKEKSMPSAAYRKSQQKNVSRARVIIVAVIIVIIAVIGYLLNIKNIYPAPEYPYPAREMGDASAKVVLEEYADYQCPYCGVFATTVQPQLIEKYVKTNKIRFVFRNMPFVDGADANQESHAAAIAALCAGEQGSFWPYHDMLFKHQTGENKGDFLRPNLVSFALQLNLDTVKFDQCLSSAQFISLIASDQNRAQFFGVNSTPTFFINHEGVAISNNMQTELFAALDLAIKAAGVSSSS